MGLNMNVYGKVREIRFRMREQAFVYGVKHERLWGGNGGACGSDSGTENTVRFKMRVYGVKVENFVETFSFLERQPPNPCYQGGIRSQRSGSVGNRLKRDLQDFRIEECNEWFPTTNRRVGWEPSSARK